MGKGNCDYRQLKQLRDNLLILEREEAFFAEACAKELAARLITLAVKRTPKDTGYLKKQWKAGVIHKQGGAYTVEVSNPVEYASYVEYGHRQEPGRYVPALGKRLKKSWVPGKFMLTLSEKDIQRAAPGILEKKLKKWLEGCVNGK